MMARNIETFQDLQGLSYVMDTVGYKVIFKSGKGYVLEDLGGHEVTSGHAKYLDFLAVCKTFYDRAKGAAKELSIVKQESE